MKKVQVYLIAAMALALAGCVHAQDAPVERPKPTLIKSISTIESNCECRSAEYDAFLAELSNNPAAQGHVVIYHQVRPTWLAMSRAKELRRHLGIRRFDASRVTIVEGSWQGDPQIELWMVPPGAENPLTKESDGVVNAGPFEQVTEPTNFTQANPDGCNSGELFLEEYAAEMNHGWEYPGRIVVYSKNVASFQKRKRELTTEIAKYEVTAKRLTFVQKPAKNGEEWVELWILPVKKGTKPKIELPGM